MPRSRIPHKLGSRHKDFPVKCVIIFTCRIRQNIDGVSQCLTVAAVLFDREIFCLIHRQMLDTFYCVFFHGHSIPAAAWISAVYDQYGTVLCHILIIIAPIRIVFRLKDGHVGKCGASCGKHMGIDVCSLFHTSIVSTLVFALKYNGPSSTSINKRIPLNMGQSE